MFIMGLQAKVQELQELKRMREELETEITAIEDEIKAAMGEREEITTTAYRITWKPVESTRIDTTALKKELPDIAARYTKTIKARRFCVN